LVFGNDNMKEAFVTAVHPGSKSDDIAVDLANGDRLTRDARIHILQRYLHGALVDNPNSSFIPLKKCKLNNQFNDKVPVATLADRLHVLVTSTRQEMQAMMNHHPDRQQNTTTTTTIVSSENTTAVMETTIVPSENTTAVTETTIVPSDNTTALAGKEEEQQQQLLPKRRPAPLAESSSSLSGASPSRRPRRNSTTHTFQDRDA
jgi:hypothetical protein